MCRPRLRQQAGEPERLLRIGQLLDRSRRARHRPARRRRSAAADGRWPRACRPPRPASCAALQRARDLRGRDAAMLADQPVADVDDGAALGRVACLDREIAFAVGAHRAVVHVGRADAQEPVVDHHDLGMDHGGGAVVAVVDVRIHQAHAVAAAPCAPCARSGCGRCAWSSTSTQDSCRCGATISTSSCLRSRSRLASRRAIGSRGHELVLDVDRCARRRRSSRGTALPPRAPPARPSIARLGAGDADVDVGEIGRRRSAGQGSPCGRRRRRLAAGRRRPALAGDLGERARRVAVHHHLHVVERLERLRRTDRRGPGCPAAWSVVSQRRMVRSSPPENATALSTTMIFWCCEQPNGTMLSRQRRDLLGRAPLQRQPRKQLALVGVEQRIVPQQQIDPQLRAAAHQLGEEFGERRRQPVVGLVAFADQPGPAVDVPAEHEDAVPCVEEGLRAPRRKNAAPSISTAARAARSMRQTLRFGRRIAGAIALLTQPPRYWFAVAK